jgi:hypothetical protein
MINKKNVAGFRTSKRVTKEVIQILAIEKPLLSHTVAMEKIWAVYFGPFRRPKAMALPKAPTLFLLIHFF